jgi:uncharacterized sporulation protein YeaH/YhbH (DUF444 family)
MDKKKKGVQDSNKGKPRSAGKSKDKIAARFADGRLTKKKIRRILRSNGTAQAKDYAEERGQTSFFRELEKSGLIARIEQVRELREERKRRARERRNERPVMPATP